MSGKEFFNLLDSTDDMEKVIKAARDKGFDGMIMYDGERGIEEFEVAVFEPKKKDLHISMNESLSDESLIAYHTWLGFHIKKVITEECTEYTIRRTSNS